MLPSRVQAVMFYVNPRAIASLYGEIFDFGRRSEAMYCFTDSMRPLVEGPFADEITRFLEKQEVQILAHQARSEVVECYPKTFAFHLITFASFFAYRPAYRIMC